jgi:hypothetical protein
MKKMYSFLFPIRIFLIGITIVMVTSVTATAQYINNNAHHLVLADNIGNNPKKTETYITKEANVVFPAVLRGNEEQSIEYVEKFAKNRRDYLMRMYKKSKKFFPKVASILNKRNLPSEYQVLLAIESAFNGNAVSSAGAVGYWQIMDDVAKEYGLTYLPQLSESEKKKLKEEAKKTSALLKKQSTTPLKKVIIKDDRKNFLRSTQAAARYLKERSRNLNNDILLIVASYNCGVGNVWEAKRKTGLNDPNFWDVKKFLPAETQNYVMNFIALNVIFNNYKNFEANTMNFKPEKMQVITEEEMMEEVTEKYTGIDY